jgi:hypothetical protein
MRLEHPEPRLSTEWIERRPWSTLRGDDQGAPSTPGERAAKAARAGAELVDLSVAVRGRDTVGTRLLARRIAARYDPQARRDGTLRKFDDGAGGPPELLQPLVEKSTARIAKRLGREPLELGAWTEAAHLAAVRHDAGFFRSRDTQPMLDRLASRAPSAVRRVRALLAEGDLQWDALATALAALSRAIASG